MFTYDGSDESLRGSHPSTWGHRAAGAEGADGGGLHSVGGDQAFLLSSRAGRAAAGLAFLGAGMEAEALQGGEGVGGKSRNGGAAAATVAMVVVFASFGARAAGARSQQDKGAVIF